MDIDDGGAGITHAVHAAKKTNVIFILADDLFADRPVYECGDLPIMLARQLIIQTLYEMPNRIKLPGGIRVKNLF